MKKIKKITNRRRFLLFDRQNKNLSFLTLTF